MPYSITTEDGITIDNIPDNIEPNSQTLRTRVAELRSGGQPKPKETKTTISQDVEAGVRDIPETTRLNC